MISGDGNFHIGDKVVYPNHGVGIIEQISSRTTGSTVERFYLLKIKASSAKVMVPFQNANSVGLRRVVRNGEAQKIVDYLTDSEGSSNGDWKVSVQGKFRPDADWLSPRSGRGPQKPALPHHQQASFVP